MGSSGVMNRIQARMPRRNGTRTLGCDKTNAVPSRTSRDESGAVLILALIFLLVIGLIVGGLASWTSNSLKNSVNFQQARSAQYALSSATQVAISNIRYTPLLNPNQTLNASPPSYCWGTSAPSELTIQSGQGGQSNQVALWCSTAWNPSSVATRTVTISACLTSVVPDTSPAQCASTPGLQTLVVFDDYSSNGPQLGASMTISSSTGANSNIPTVTSLSPAQGPVTGGTTVTVGGTGFVSGSTTVNFVAVGASANIILPGVVAVNSPTSLTVTTPPTTTVSSSNVSYYVIVTTSYGSSVAGAPSAFTYQPVVPTVTSLGTVTTGSAAGGTSVSITGTGFLGNKAGDNTQINFVDTANTSIIVPAPNLIVNSSTSITATSPSVSQDTTYYVTATTFPVGGTSATNPSAEFTFVPLTPVAASVSPTSAGSQSVTITGIGFVNNATSVQLIPTSGNFATLNATNVSVASSTTLTATVPTGGHAGTAYYVEVTTTSGGGSCPSQQNGGCAAGGAAPQYTY
jgi:Tfp pilus assembly protein PilX